MQMIQNKKIFSPSNIFTAILIAFTIAILFFPNFKALIIQGLMNVGLFQPAISANKISESNTPANRVSAIFVNAAGDQVDTKNLEGKVIFINFWATWCPPCIAEMPSINKLYLKYKDNKNIVFIIADADADLAASTSFMKKREFGLPLYIPQTIPPKEWFEGSLPTTIVLDKKGNIAYRHSGAANYNSSRFQGFIDDLLKQ